MLVSPVPQVAVAASAVVPEAFVASGAEDSEAEASVVDMAPREVLVAATSPTVTSMQTTPALTNRLRLAAPVPVVLPGSGWMHMAAGMVWVAEVEGSVRQHMWNLSLASRLWFETYVVLGDCFRGRKLNADGFFFTDSCLGRLRTKILSSCSRPPARSSWRRFSSRERARRAVVSFSLPKYRKLRRLSVRAPKPRGF